MTGPSNVGDGDWSRPTSVFVVTNDAGAIRTVGVNEASAHRRIGASGRRVGSLTIAPSAR